ncbi:hypothetical protein [Aquipuribacter sp. SD81]|uniref:hypothetical protein n=1 Tax=Aquipuribacter sp. SD81 TaxID=3127703 RepID=UPI0030165EF9
MQLDHVRELKAAWAAWAAAPTQAPTDRAGARPSAAEALPPPEPAAVALGATRTGSGYGLAVRYREEGPAVSRLVERMREEVGEAELDVRHVGAVRALALDPQWAPDPSSRAAVDVGRLRSRLRPLVVGASVAHERVTAGTVGAFVRADGAWFVLSNSHVLARSGLASPGDVVLQPGPADGGVGADRIGVLDRAVPLAAERANAVDAALARLDDGVEVDLSGAPTATALLDGDEPVEKTGRTTGATTGRVSAIEVDDVVVDFGPGVGLLRFDGQVEVQGEGRSFSAGGDSGSLVRLAGGGAGVGLLFAGSEQGGPGGTGLTYCNVLDDVLAALGVALPTS